MPLGWEGIIRRLSQIHRSERVAPVREIPIKLHKNSFGKTFMSVSTIPGI